MRQTQQAVAVFFAVAFGLALGLALLMAATGTSVHMGTGTVFVTMMMWAPFIGRTVATRTVDRNWKPPFPFRRWGRPSSLIVGVPLVLVLVIYGTAHSVGWLLGAVAWNPGEGKWDTVGRIFLNLALNLPILGLLFTLGALGEELGWRGYLQPRLDAAGVKHSLMIVIALEVVWHLPVMMLGGYLLGDSRTLTALLFTALTMFTAPLWAWSVYRMRSVWAAVFFHSFHNLTSQWLFPKLFAVSKDTVLLGEFGVLPVVCYGVTAGIWRILMRRKGVTWQQVANSALMDLAATKAWERKSCGQHFDPAVSSDRRCKPSE